MPTLNSKQQETFDKCYAVYKCPKGRLKKGSAEVSWKKRVLTDELGNEIFEHILSFNRYQRDVGERIDYNRGFTEYLNQYGWRDEIPSRSEAKVATDVKPCNCCQTMGKIVIGSQSFCDDEYRRFQPNKYANQLNEVRREHKLFKQEGESSAEFRKRCAWM